MAELEENGVGAGEAGTGTTAAGGTAGGGTAGGGTAGDGTAGDAQMDSWPDRESGDPESTVESNAESVSGWTVGVVKQPEQSRAARRREQSDSAGGFVGWRERRRMARRARRDWRRSRPGILPRTFLGLAVVVLCLAVGAAAAGVGAVVWFQWRLDHVQASFDSRLANLSRLNGPGGALGVSGTGNLTSTTDAVVRLRTVTELGNPTVAEAFVTSTDGTQAYLLTALSAVRRSTWDPEAAIAVTSLGGGVAAKATIWSWDERSGLAVLVVDLPGVPRLEWVSGNPGGGTPVTVPGATGTYTVGEAFDGSVTLEGDTTSVVPGAPVLQDGKVLGLATAGGAGATFVRPQRSCEQLFSCSG